MNVDQFINNYNGKGIDTDGAYGNQCMDLMHRYIIDVLGLSAGVLAAPTAFQAYTAGNGSFDKIANTPTGVPQKGDIIFWNTTVGSAGHVAIFIDGDAKNFRSFDQNWPTGSVSHIQSHNYNGVAGWLRRKGAEPQMADALIQVRQSQIDNWLHGPDGIDHWKVESFNLSQQIAQLQTQVQNIQTQLDSKNKDNVALTKQVTDLQAQVAKGSGDVSSLTISDLVGLIWTKIRNVKIK